MDEILLMYKLGIIRFGEFTLSSGTKSSFYINMRELPSYPVLFGSIMEKAISKIDPESFDVVCGVATGGIPIAAYLAFSLNKPLGYVRSSRKNHGLEELVVGRVREKRILIVDDVATTGDSLIRSIVALRNAGATVNNALVIVLRNKFVIKRLNNIGVTLHFVYNALDLVTHLHRVGAISNETYAYVVDEIEE